jgi:hypothetical protein
VLAHHVHVADLEARARQVRQRVADRAHDHVRGHVGLDERPAAGRVHSARHLLDERPAAGAQGAVQRGGEHRVVLLADVLAHLDRADGVERAVRGR